MARTAQASANDNPPVIIFSPKRGRILSGQRSDSLPGDVLHRAFAGDFPILRGALVPRGRPLAVVVDQRPGLRPVDLEALLHRLLAVVVAQHQRLAGDVVASLGSGRVELAVVDPAGARVTTASAHPPYDLEERLIDIH